MAQSGCMNWDHGSRNTCKRNQELQNPNWVKKGLELGVNMADDDWETDPDYVNNGSGESGDREISTASIISDLSRSIRDCSLGQLNPRTKEYIDYQRHSCQVSGENPLKNRYPNEHPAPGFSIERSSLFTHNAAEKLETFLSEKLHSWGSHAPCQSKNMESRQRHHRKGHPEGMTERLTHVQLTDGIGNTKRIGDTCHLGAFQDPWHLQQNLGGKRWASEGLLWKREGSGPSTAVSSSARILPQCRISHIQRCHACQAFNQDQPPVPYENCWTPLREEDHGSMADCQEKEPAAPSSRQQVSDRLSKVQRWLEQTPVERPPGPDLLRHRNQRPDIPGWCHDYTSLNQKDGDLWAREIRNCRRPGAAAEMRPRWTRHQGENHNHHHHHQPSVQILPCDDGSISPPTCNCLFCEQQRPRAQLVSGKVQPDLSVEEVAQRLQAENRISRIVEAFERRTLREAKRMEKRGGRVTATVSEPKRVQRSSSAKAHKSHLSAKERHEEGRTMQPRKRHSFMDRLRGIH
ncbi:uncharacterized protein LOC121923527 [Sceloporus undulatus]|uniref:uncharacterized protein LOC121923527 n=1 Tax=Sceloporus undulatus TaxID=8520 RepID=UPI001C4B6CA1|nr:uncharacterized protein LOC121923527 [Sceloporus undulatus]XP_042309979.1 uncharacterized protein LOC121923527 [Sceloporus undulatus]